MKKGISQFYQVFYQVFGTVLILIFIVLLIARVWPSGITMEDRFQRLYNTLEEASNPQNSPELTSRGGFTIEKVQSASSITKEGWTKVSRPSGLIIQLYGNDDCLSELEEENRKDKFLQFPDEEKMDKWENHFLICMVTADYRADSKTILGKMKDAIDPSVLGLEVEVTVEEKDQETSIKKGIVPYNTNKHSEVRTKAAKLCKDITDESLFYIWNNSMRCVPMSSKGESAVYLNVYRKGPLAWISSGPNSKITFSFMEFQGASFEKKHINMTYALT